MTGSRSKTVTHRRVCRAPGGEQATRPPARRRGWVPRSGRRGRPGPVVGSARGHGVGEGLAAREALALNVGHRNSIEARTSNRRVRGKNGRDRVSRSSV